MHSLNRAMRGSEFGSSNMIGDVVPCLHNGWCLSLPVSSSPPPTLVALSPQQPYTAPTYQRSTPQIIRRRVPLLNEVRVDPFVSPAIQRHKCSRQRTFRNTVQIEWLHR